MLRDAWEIESRLPGHGRSLDRPALRCDGQIPTWAPEFAPSAGQEVNLTPFRAHQSVGA